jgi:BirA family transcriptional regulator, biotin operon repressor / biotin---[acetyl-CoA-carboxylase] ligase
MMPFTGKINFLGEVESTNLVAEKRLTAGNVAEGTVFFADYQWKGKGVGSNSWHSNRGENVLMSMVFYPDFLDPADQFMLHKVVSSGVCDCLKSYLADEAINIKWPNDIYVRGGKIAGILGKNFVIGQKLETAIIGIGLNVNQQDFDKVLPNPVSMANIAGSHFDRMAVTQSLAQQIWKHYQMLRSGLTDEINGRYLSGLLNFNKPATYRAAGKKFVGIIRNVDAFGYLIVETEGKLRKFDMKEIALVQ